MNWRITEMEDELRCRNEGCALMGKPIRSPRTSYALAGTDVRRQRKYRKGPILCLYLDKDDCQAAAVPAPARWPVCVAGVEVHNGHAGDRGCGAGALLLVRAGPD